MDQDLLEKFIEKIDKVVDFLGQENGNVVKTNLITAVFVDFRDRFLDKNANQEFINQLSGITDTVEFGKKLDELGLNSTVDFEESCTEVLTSFISELEPNLEPEKVVELKSILSS